MLTGFLRSLAYLLVISLRSPHEERETREDRENREPRGKASSPHAYRRSYFVAVLDHTLFGAFHGRLHSIQVVVRGCSTGRSAGSESRLCRRLLPWRPLGPVGLALVHHAHHVVCKYGERRADALAAVGCTFAVCIDPRTRLLRSHLRSGRAVRSCALGLPG